MGFAFLDHDTSTGGFCGSRPPDVNFNVPMGKDGKPIEKVQRPAEWLLGQEEKEYSRRFDALYGDCQSPPDASEAESLLRQFLHTFTGQSLYLLKTDSVPQQQYEFSQYLLANYQLTDLVTLLKTVRVKAPTSIITKEDFQQYFRQELFCKIKTDLNDKYKKEEIISLNTRDFKQNLILNAVNAADLLIRLDVDSDALNAALNPEIKTISESKDISDLLNAIRTSCQTIFKDPLSNKHSYPDRNLSTFIKTKTGDARHRALLGAYLFAKWKFSDEYDMVYVQDHKLSSRPVLLIADKKQEQYYLLDPSSDKPPRKLTLQAHWEESAESKSMKSAYGLTENGLLKLCFKPKIEQKVIDESKKIFAALKKVKTQVDAKITQNTVWQSSYFQRFACQVPGVVTAISGELSNLTAQTVILKNFTGYESKSDAIVKKATDAINNHTSRFFKSTPDIRKWYKNDIIAKLVYTDQTNLDTIKAMIETHQFEFSKWLPKKRCGRLLKDAKGNTLNQVPQRIFDIYNVIISTTIQGKDKASEIAILAAEAIQHGNSGQQESTIQFYQKILDSLIKQTTRLQRLLA